MPGVIDRQIESLQTSAGEVAAPTGREDAAARRRDVDDLLSVAVALYEHTTAGVRKWQASAADWESAAWVEQARVFEARYRRLRDAFAGIARLLADSQLVGFNPEAAEQFRRAKLDLDVLCELSVDRMLKTDAQFQQGHGRTMAEVRDELRRRLGA